MLDVFNINFTEEQAPGTETVQLPETIDKDEVDDLDDPPTQVCYFIINGNDDGLFVLDIFNHELTVRVTIVVQCDMKRIKIFNVFRPQGYWTGSSKRNIC